MPFINTKLNVALTKEKEASLKAKLGEAIAAFPGKSEYWLMLNFEDNCRMWFRGYNSFPVAFVEIQLFGSSDHATCDQMTKIVCKIMKDELNIAPHEREDMAMFLEEMYGVPIDDDVLDGFETVEDVVAHIEDNLT